jgi:hypothetical protein
MLKQTRESDLKLFLELSKAAKPKSKDEVPMTVVIPAYAISELKTGFQMGFFLFVPFLIIDLVVSTTLLSMGMMQLPPAMISLPFKVLLFVMIRRLESRGRLDRRSFAYMKGISNGALHYGDARTKCGPADAVGKPKLYFPFLRRLA